jgi:hypothetical protein
MGNLLCMNTTIAVAHRGTLYHCIVRQSMHLMALAGGKSRSCANGWLTPKPFSASITIGAVGDHQPL